MEPVCYLRGLVTTYNLSKAGRFYIYRFVVFRYQKLSLFPYKSPYFEGNATVSLCGLGFLWTLLIEEEEKERSGN